jgi:molecular chaperone DnaK (HSP70)
MISSTHLETDKSIAVAIENAGCSVASINFDGFPTLISDSADRENFLTPFEIAFDRATTLSPLAHSYERGVGGEVHWNRPFREERFEVGKASRKLRRDNPTVDGAVNILSLLDSDTVFEWEGNKRSPSELVERIARKLRDDVEHSWVGPCSSITVSVPSELNHFQRSTLVRIFRSSGMEHVRLIDSALAASFHFQPKPSVKPIVVCELRNDGVQASLVRVSETERVVLSTKLVRIAEQDRLTTVVIAGLRTALGNVEVDNVPEEAVTQSLWIEAGEWIESILETKQSCHTYRRVVLGKMLGCELTAERISALGEVYFEKAADCLSGCLKEAGLSWEEIEFVSFFGEYAELTKVVDNYTCFASIPVQARGTINARWAAAFGAALCAQTIAQGSQVNLRPISTSDISLRTRSTNDARFGELPIFGKGIQLPGKVFHTFKTSRMDQERLVFEIVESGDTESKVVKTAAFGPLFPQLERHPIEVRFTLNEQGLLHVIARDGVTKKEIASLPTRS